MKYDYHAIILGAGSAGLVVATGLTNLGAKVALLEGHLMGGECLNAGCVPTKAFLNQAYTSHKNTPLDYIMDQVQGVVEQLSHHDSKEHFEQLGVDVYSKYGQVLDKHTVLAGQQKLTCKYIVIATGSQANIPNIPGLKSTPYYTNDNIFSMKKRPDHLIILGSGTMALEFGQAFSHLGSKVSILSRSNRLFKKDEPEVSDLMTKIFKEEGINLIYDSQIQEVGYKDKFTLQYKQNADHKSISGDTLLLALGRKPNSQNLNLERLGVHVDKRGFIQTDQYMRTSVKNIFACGDVTGPYLFTHMAAYQAGLVIRNIIMPLKKSANYQAVPWVTFTKPEVAHVGALAKDHKSYLMPLSDNDKANTAGMTQGFYKVVLDSKNRVIGATIVSDHAAETIHFANLAIKQKLKLTSFMEMIFPYPTESELYKTIALHHIRNNLKPWHKKIIRKII